MYNPPNQSLLKAIRQIKETKDVLVIHLRLDSTWNDVYKYELSLRALPLPTQVKITSKRHIADQHTALANQLLQRRICEAVEPNCRFKYGRYGKPYVNDEFGFSMSNQQGHVAMIIQSGVEVGVDLASVDDLEEGWEELYVDIMNEIEIIQIGNDKKQFTKLWSLKEAYTKYTGLGLNCDLKELAFVIGQGDSWVESKLLINNVEQSQKFYTKEIEDGLFLTVCTEIESTLNVHEIELEDFIENFPQ